MDNLIAISYRLEGKQQILHFQLSNPEWRETIRILRQQNKVFRLAYVSNAA